MIEMAIEIAIWFFLTAYASAAEPDPAGALWNSLEYVANGPFVDVMDPGNHHILKRYYTGSRIRNLTVQKEGVLVELSNAQYHVDAGGLKETVIPSADPEMVDWLFHGAVMLAGKGAFGSMESSGSPSYLYSRSLLGRSLAPVNMNLNEVVSIYRKAAESDPANPYLNFLLGQSLRWLGNEKEASASFDQALNSGDLPFFEYSRLGNLFEILYEPRYADLCFRKASLLFKQQVQVIPGFCSDRLHRLFFPADLDAAQAHLAQGNFYRAVELREFRKELFPTVENDVEPSYRILRVSREQRFAAQEIKEQAYLNRLKETPFVFENHLAAVDLLLNLRVALILSSFLALLVVYRRWVLVAGSILLPLFLLVRTFFRFSYKTVSQWGLGFPLFLIWIFSIAFSPFVLISRMIRSLRISAIPGVALSMWLLFCGTLFFAGARSPRILIEIYGTVFAYWLITVAFRNLKLGMKSIRGFPQVLRDLKNQYFQFVLRVAEEGPSTPARPWRSAAILLVLATLGCSLVLSIFPVSSIYSVKHLPEGVTFLYGDPAVLSFIESEEQRATGKDDRELWSFLRATAYQVQGKRKDAMDIYRRLAPGPWVLNNLAVLEFQEGNRGKAEQEWSVLAKQGFAPAAGNLASLRGAGSEAGGKGPVFQLGNLPERDFFRILVRRSPRFCYWSKRQIISQCF